MPVIGHFHIYQPQSCKVQNIIPEGGIKWSLNTQTSQSVMYFTPKVNTKVLRAPPRGHRVNVKLWRRPIHKVIKTGDSLPASHTCKKKAPVYDQKKEMTVHNPPVNFGRCFCSHLPSHPLLFVKWALSDNSKSSWHHHRWQPQMWQIPSNSKRTHVGSAQQRLCRTDYSSFDNWKLNLSQHVDGTSTLFLQVGSQ